MRKPLRAVGLVFGLTLTLAVTTAAGALLGDYLDRRWGTGPWLSLVGTLLGMGCGLWQVLSEARRVDGDR
jgi:F0F1-type ATP synthase assembly protein I